MTDGYLSIIRFIPSALTVDWSEWAGTLGEAHGLALQKPVSHQGGWYYFQNVALTGKRVSTNIGVIHDGPLAASVRKFTVRA